MDKIIPKVKLLEEFKAFLLKHGVIGLAVGVVLGAAVGKTVKALVDDLIMPIVGFLSPSGDWRSMMLPVGPIKFAIGDLLGNLIDLTIVAFVVFLIIKTLIKEAKPADAPATRQCPDCMETVLAAAKKCKHCGSGLRAAA